MTSAAPAATSVAAIESLTIEKASSALVGGSHAGRHGTRYAHGSAISTANHTDASATLATDRRY